LTGSHTIQYSWILTARDQEPDRQARRTLKAGVQYPVYSILVFAFLEPIDYDYHINAKCMSDALEWHGDQSLELFVDRLIAHFRILLERP
jgi:hypothetical protein